MVGMNKLQATRCHHPRPSGERKCHDCKKICFTCGNERKKQSDGKYRCVDCSRERQRAWRSGETGSNQNCPCGQPKSKGPGRKLCDDCALLCARCEKYNRIDNSSYCRWCHKIAIASRKYGIDLSEVEEMYSRKKCDSCGRYASGKGLVIDHCHNTGQVRGVLCTQCNIALGMLGDNPDTILALYSYLEGASQ